MNIITKRDKIRQAFKDFDHDNRDKKDSDTSWKGWTFGDMRVALARLDPDKCSAEDVSNILNESWVSLICDECNKECNVLLHIGQPEDYDNRWWDMCHDCLSSGMKMMEGVAKQDRERFSAALELARLVSCSWVDIPDKWKELAARAIGEGTP